MFISDFINIIIIIIFFPQVAWQALIGQIIKVHGGLGIGFVDWTSGFGVVWRRWVRMFCDHVCDVLREEMK